MVREEIIQLIEKVTGEKNVNLEVPENPLHGDYSTNIALKLKKDPEEIVKLLTKELKNRRTKELFEKVEVAGPGFINFYLSRNFFIKKIKEVLKDKKFGKNENLKNQKVIIEYTDPNILKDFHVGHLMNNAIGESLSRIFEFQGARVKRLCYQGDVGLHVAKAIFGKIKNPNLSWQESYVFGSKEYESKEKSKKEIIELNKKIFNKSDKKINRLYEQGKKESLKNFDRIYQKLNTKFDYLFFESQIANIGKKIVQSGVSEGIFEKGEKGAIVFKGEKFGLHTRVFINSAGLPTYEAKELGLAKIKYDKFKYDKSVIITANEQNDYFKVVLRVMSNIFPDLAEKTKQIGHGMMRLQGGKMSSRIGNIVIAEQLIEDIKQKIKEKIGPRKLDDSEIEKIAIGAIKYSILKQSIGSDIIYDFEKSISFEGDSGPYLQYSYVRANSVLEKAKKEKIKSDPNFKFHPNDPNYRISNLEKNMHKFEEVIEDAGKKYEPHEIATYLIKLAKEFNNYYSKVKIVDKADQFSPYKVALTEAFSIIVKNGLWLLGIPGPNRM